MPFTSILYANGPGYVHINGTRGNITMVDYCKHKLMSFRCGTRLCWCVYRQRELMWLWLTHACVFLWQAKIKYDVLFSAQASQCTCNFTLKKIFVFLYGILESNDPVPPPLVLHHWLQSLHECVYTWRWKHLYPGMNYLLKPPILPLWMDWRHFIFLEHSCVCTLNPSGTLSKHAITSEGFISSALCLHLEKYEALLKSGFIFWWRLWGQKTIATYL